jgi:hypothetical protein
MQRRILPLLEKRAEEYLMSQPADVDALKNRIEQLSLEHRDLDDVIARLLEITPHDQLQVQRLKKRKLFIKDQISVLERQLTPDILA